MTPRRVLALAIGVLVTVAMLIGAAIWFVEYREERRAAAAGADFQALLGAQMKLLQHQKLSAAEIGDVRARCKHARDLESMCADIEERLTRP